MRCDIKVLETRTRWTRGPVQFTDTPKSSPQRSPSSLCRPCPAHHTQSSPFSYENDRIWTTFCRNIRSLSLHMCPLCELNSAQIQQTFSALSSAIQASPWQLPQTSASGNSPRPKNRMRDATIDDTILFRGSKIFWKQWRQLFRDIKTSGLQQRRRLGWHQFRR